MSRLTHKNIKSVYSKEKARNDFENHPWAYYVIRPISFYLTPFFINIGFSANGLTLFGFLPLISAFIIISFANSLFSLLIGGILFNIWYLIDFIDGNIARFQNTSSELGKYLDSFAGTLFHVLLPLSIALFFYNGARFDMSFNLAIDDNQAFFLSLMMVLFFVLRKIASQKFSLIKLNDNSTTFKGKKLSLNILILRGISSIKAPLFLLFTAFGFLKLWLLFYSVYSFITLVGIMYFNIRRLI